MYLPPVPGPGDRRRKNLIFYPSPPGGCSGLSGSGPLLFLGRKAGKRTSIRHRACASSAPPPGDGGPMLLALSTFHVFLAEGGACHASGGPLSSDGKGRKVAGAPAPDPIGPGGGTQNSSECKDRKQLLAGSVVACRDERRPQAALRATVTPHNLSVSAFETPCKCRRVCPATEPMPFPVRFFRRGDRQPLIPG